MLIQLHIIVSWMDVHLTFLDADRATKTDIQNKNVLLTLPRRHAQVIVNTVFNVMYRQLFFYCFNTYYSATLAQAEECKKKTHHNNLK